MFHTILILMTEGRWKMSTTVITERPLNSFLGIINTSPNPGSIFLHKSLDTTESSSTIKVNTCNKLFLKAALDLSFRPSNFDADLI